MSLTLLIDEGDLPSLAACAVAADPQHLTVWHRAGDDPAAGRRRAAAAAHAQAWSVAQLVVGPAGDPGAPELACPERLLTTARLVQASIAACQLGCRRVIWPIACGHDPDAVVEAVDRAHTVAALIGPDAGREPVEIDLPLLDLTDVQVLEVADDAGAPLQAFWPCVEGSPEPCTRCEPCRRWRRAFEASGLPWPWAVVTRRPRPVAAPAAGA
jgi:hypothetical protein